MIINRKKLRKMMEERKFNIPSLAKRAGLSYEGLWIIINKEGHNVSNNSLQKISWAFGLTFMELKDLLGTKEEIDLDLDKKIKELERELKIAKRKLEPKVAKLNLVLRKYQLAALKELSEEKGESLNNYMCILIDELIERVEEKSLETI